MTETTIYKPTFLQKLLGRNYKWWYLIIYSFKQTNIKFVSFLIGNFASVLDFSITIYLWVLIDPTKDRITYFFVGFMLQRLIWNQYSGILTENIISGKIANRLIVPSNNFKFWFFREIGSSLLRNTISSLLIFSFLPIYSNYLRLPNLTFLLVLPFCLSVAFFIDYCISYILASFAFWTEDVRPIGYLMVIFIKILSGIAIPFSYLSEPFNTILQFNPYALISYHPMQIYLGKYSNLEIFYVFLGGLAWCIILYFLAKWVFKMGLKKNEAVGL
jgi:ABC-2 type transport system permease protein